MSHLLARRVVDVAVLTISLWTAFLLRFDFTMPEASVEQALIVTPFVVLLQMLALHRFGVHRLLGRHISFDDLGAFVAASITWLVPMLAVRIVFPPGTWRIPLSVSLIDTLVAVVGLLAVRLALRMHAELWRGETTLASGTTPVLLVGAGEAGLKVAREIRRHNTDLHVVGFVDDDPAKRDAKMAGFEVVGKPEDIPGLVEQYGVDHVIVTIIDPAPGVMQRIAAICAAVPIRVRTVPSFFEIVQGTGSLTAFQDVDVEDLLGRDPVRLDLMADLHGYLNGRVVMVTGAGGSIGSELARQVAGFTPSRLVLVEQFEGSLFTIQRELVDSYPEVTLMPYVANVADSDRMRSIFASCRPDVVVHAAAHKHVAMMEHNSGEAIKNNTFGTEVVAEMAGVFGASCFVLVSTDKAVRPSSIMGASKRLAEMVVQHFDEKFENSRFIAVRFGNVMASSGSVVPIFQDQVRRGGPVTVTHEDASRYFMTIPEASRLVLTAGAIGHGGEVMVLDMGQPVRIIDLARNLIKLSGYVPDRDISIEITGLKPGEKISEELYTDGEAMELTRHPKIFIGRAHGHEEIQQVLKALRPYVDDGQDDDLRRLLSDSIPDSQLAAPLLEYFDSVSTEGAISERPFGEAR